MSLEASCRAWISFLKNKHCCYSFTLHGFLYLFIIQQRQNHLPHLISCYLYDFLAPQDKEELGSAGSQETLRALGIFQALIHLFGQPIKGNSEEALWSGPLTFILLHRPKSGSTSDHQGVYNSFSEHAQETLPSWSQHWFQNGYSNQRTSHFSVFFRLSLGIKGTSVCGYGRSCRGIKKSSITETRFRASAPEEGQGLESS